jgi:hypothetical protein
VHTILLENSKGKKNLLKLRSRYQPDFKKGLIQRYGLDSTVSQYGPLVDCTVMNLKIAQINGTVLHGVSKCVYKQAALQPSK